MDKNFTKVPQSVEKETTTSISNLEHIKNAIDNATTGTTERYPDVYTVHTPDAVTKHWREGQAHFFQTANKHCLRIDILHEFILRFRYTWNTKFERDFSYAIDPKFKASSIHSTFSETETAFRIHTPQVHCFIAKADLQVRIEDTEGNLISTDAAPFRAITTLEHGLAEIKITKVAQEDEAYYGLGDKASALNLRGQSKQNWNSDAFGYGLESDPLYRSIPFYLGLQAGIGYGIFMDNSYRSHFDFDSNEKGEMSFAAEGGEMNYYFIAGPKLLDVAERYTELTGRAELPPMWALGFHQCRWSYYPEQQVRDLANTFRELQIPCDAIYLDIDYMDGYRCFTWNHDHFLNPTNMIGDLEKQGFQTVVMIDPGLRVDEDYEVYTSGLEIDAYCKRSTGELMVGPVWPPACVFPDYTRPDVREWWGKLYHELYVEQGVSGFWNDMNEPAMFKVNSGTIPDDVLHDYDGELTNHRKAHNIYGLQMSRATTEGLKKLKPNKRPFLLTRASFSGGQRFAAAWTGDNVASWEHLHIANTQSQRMSASGFSFIGSDIGGFADQPTGELMVRWLQSAIFHPFFRVHSMGNKVDGASEVEQSEIEKQERENRMSQEPWAFGDEWTALARAAIELRYAWLPYIYSTFWQYSNYGTPMMRSAIFHDQHDPKLRDEEQTFLFGDNVLICPIENPIWTDSTEEDIEAIVEHEIEDDAETKEKIQRKSVQEVYLPKGHWYDYWTKQVYEGNLTIDVKIALDRIPIFVKAGAVLPHYPVQQYVGEKVIEELTLHIFYVNGEARTTLYEDAGEGYKYEKGNYSLKTYHIEGSENQFDLTRWKEGTFQESYSTCRLKIYGLPFVVESCTVNDKNFKFEQNKDVNYVELVVNSSFYEVGLLGK